MQVVTIGFILIALFLPKSAFAMEGKEQTPAQIRLTKLLDRSRITVLSNPDSGRVYGEMALEIAQKDHDRSSIGIAHSRIGYSYLRQAVLDSAEAHFNQSFAVFESIGDSAHMGTVLLQLGSVSMRRRDSVQVVAQYDRAMLIAMAIGDTTLQGNCLIASGTFLARTGNFKEAKAKFLVGERLIEANAVNAKMRMAVLANLAGVYIQEGKFDSAATMNLKSAKLCKKIGDNQTLGQQYVNVARIFIKAGDYDKAIEYCEEAEMVWSEMAFTSGLAQVKVVLARIYRLKGEPDQAILLAKEGVKMHRDGKILSQFFLEGLVQWGKSLCDLKRHDEALPFYKEAEQLNLEIRDRFQGVQIALGLADLYNRMENYSASQQALAGVAGLVEQGGSNLQRLELYESEIVALKGLGKFKEALQYAQKAKDLRESVYKEEQLSVVESLQLEFDVAEKDRAAKASKLEAKSAQLETELVAQSFRTTMIIACILLLGMIAGILWYRTKMKTRQRTLELENKITEESLRRKELEEENLRIRYAQLERQALQAQMNPHFLFNSLASLQSHILAGDLALAEDFLTRFSRLVRNILNASRKSGVSISEVVGMLEDYMEMEKLRFGDQMDYEIRLQQDLEADLVHIPPMLVQPYVENAIIHGIAALHKKGKIVVDFREIAADYIRVLVEDNGVGREESQKKKQGEAQEYPSLGSRIAEERLELNFSGKKGTVEIQDLVGPNGQAMGTRVCIDVPILEGV